MHLPASGTAYLPVIAVKFGTPRGRMCVVVTVGYNVIMNRYRTFGALLMAAMALTGAVACATPAIAQTYNSGNPGVANVSVANGSVVILRGDSGAQVAATVNAP